MRFSIPQKLRVKPRLRKFVDGLLAGKHRSILRGAGVTFEDVRQYHPGDDVRYIDWNLTARSDCAYVKLFGQERNQRLLVVQDCSSSLAHFPVGWDRVAQIGMLLAWSGLMEGDQVGFAFFADQVKKLLPTTRSNLILYQAARQYSEAGEVARGLRTDFESVVGYFRNLKLRRSTVILLSDFLATDYARHLRLLARSHQLLLVHLTSERLETMASGVYRLKDAESGETIIWDANSENRARASESMEKRSADLRHLAVETSSDYIPIDLTVDPIEQLVSYFRG